MWRLITVPLGLRLNAVSGMRLLVHPSWILFWAILGWLAVTEGAPAAYPEHDAHPRWLRALLANVLLLASAVLHEAAHLVVRLRLRLPLRRVVLFPFGGVRTGGAQNMRWHDQFLLAAAGPLTSLVAGLILLGAAPDGTQPLAMWIGLFNVALAAVNLVPVEPLDGAALLQAVGRKRGITAFKLTRFSFRAADVVANVLVWLGLLTVIVAGRFEGLLLVLFGCMLQIGSRVHRVQENPQHKKIMRRTPVAEIARKLPPRASATSTAERPQAPTARPKDAPAGGPGDGATLPSTYSPALAPWRIAANVTLEKALERLDQAGTPGHLFVVEEHRIIGVCSRSDLLDYIFSYNKAVRKRV